MAKVQYTSDQANALKAKAQFNQAYEALTTGWAALDQAGKQAALQQGLMVTMRIVRYIMGRLL
jgi:hypothetical protein